jgi:hypothetical protein
LRYRSGPRRVSPRLIGAPQRKNLLLRRRRPMKAGDAQKRFERAGDPSRPDTRRTLWGGQVSRRRVASVGSVDVREMNFEL